MSTLVDAIDRLLPQTQCTQCGFAGCRPYAQALARGEVDIDHCPPGGDDGARALAALLGVAPRPVDRNRGAVKPAQVVWIDEALCIGCTKCIQACPVDAIVGAAQLMHTVLRDECTGCELCIAPCPVDCIHIQALDATPWSAAARGPQTSRQRFDARNMRLAGAERARVASLEARRVEVGNSDHDPLAAALARAQARRRPPAAAG